MDRHPRNTLIIIIIIMKLKTGCSSTESDGSENLIFIVCLNQDIFFQHFNFQNRVESLLICVVGCVM